VLVAWKDTREAARALRDALPLLRECEHATLLEVGEGAAAEGDDESLQAAGRWLAAHGVGADLRREADVCGAANQLLSRAADLGADLLVAGGYGHSRLREWVLGGVTRHLLKHMTVPILMSH
jgi:nucleotide-binding universal stress UspA family protein